jgi:hypothetical protein
MNTPILSEVDMIGVSWPIGSSWGGEQEVAMTQI